MAVSGGSVEAGQLFFLSFALSERSKSAWQREAAGMLAAVMGSALGSPYPGITRKLRGLGTVRVGALKGTKKGPCGVPASRTGSGCTGSGHLGCCAHRGAFVPLGTAHKAGSEPRPGDKGTLRSTKGPAPPAPGPAPHLLLPGTEPAAAEPRGWHRVLRGLRPLGECRVPRVPPATPLSLCQTSAEAGTRAPRGHAAIPSRSLPVAWHRRGAAEVDMGLGSGPAGWR